MQEGMLFHGLNGGPSGVDLEQVVATLPEAFDEAAFLEAWRRVTGRHPILRTAFRWEGVGAPCQEVHAEVEIPCRRHDWPTVQAKDLEGRLADFLAEDRREGFDLTKAPLQRLSLIGDAEGLRTFVWTFHHALLDGRSFPIVLREVFEVYDAIRSGAPWEPPPSRPFRDYVAWLRGRDWPSAEAHFRALLSGFRAPNLLGSARAGSDTGGAPGAVEIRLPAGQTEALRSFALTHGVTLNTLLQGAWALLVQRYCGTEDVVFGATRACRRSALDGDADGIVGLLINTLPLRAKVEPNAPLVPWLQELRAQQVALRPYEHTPLVKVQGWSEVPRGRALFDTLVVFENETLDATLRAVGGRWSERRFLYRGQTSFPVTVIGYGDPEMLLRIEYDRGRFSAEAGERLLGHLVTLLGGMAASPASRRLGEIPMVGEEERRRLLVGPERRYEAGPCLHERFEAVAAGHPDRVAVVYEGASLTYGELNRRANRLAHRLRALGVGPETLVGLRLERSLDLVVGILGILKAGGAYLPLDPDYPQDRLAFMIADAGVSHVVAKRGEASSGEAGRAAVVYVDDDEPGSEENPESGASASSLAYVIYTSGSTGRPKGVPGDARERDAPAGSDGPLVRVRRGRRVDAVPLVRVRLLGVGAVGRAAATGAGWWWSRTG